MQPGSCLNDLRDLTRLQGERCFLKLFLHVALPKESPDHSVSVRSLTGLPHRHVKSSTQVTGTSALAVGSSEPRRKRNELRQHSSATSRRKRNGGAEHLQITSLPRGGAIALRRRQVAQAGAAVPDALLVALDDAHCVVLGARNVRFAPALRPPGVAVLDEEMRATHLAVQVLLGRCAVVMQIGRVVLAHVVFERFRVGIRWRLPFGLLGVGVEVVREVFAVGVSDLLWRERCELTITLIR